MTWLALGVSAVDRAGIEPVLADAGVVWDNALHVTATGSLAREIRRQDGVALPLQVLMNLVHAQARPEWPLDVTAFPNPRDLKPNNDRAYNDQLAEWQHREAGRSIRLRIAFDQALRDILDAEAPTPEARVLRRNRRVLFNSLREAASFGANPANLAPTTAIEELLARIWPELEGRMPALAQPRDDLWHGPVAVRTRTQTGRDLERRIRTTLELAFGQSDTPRTLVYHGFYYYDPSQWAWFQLLRELPQIGQVFIVHDDGASATTETWRRFFHHDWSMPSAPLASEPPPSAAGAALRNAAAGNRVDPYTTGQSLRIVRCENVPEFVRLWRATTNQDRAANRERRVYAPASGDVRRTIERLVPSVDSQELDLRDLPAGRFLLAAHRCLVSDQPGTYRITADSILDMADSQLLGDIDTTSIAALRRALPYFARCRSDREWLTRLKQFEGAHALIASVEPAHTNDDLGRIKNSANASSRVVPWADLSEAQVATVTSVIRGAIDAIRDFGASHRAPLRQHLRKMWSYLEEGRGSLSVARRRELELKFKSFAMVSDQPLSLEGMVDMVIMLLGSAVEPASISHTDRDEVEIRALRGLDAVGYRPAASLHLANLADQLFPARTDIAPWPLSASGYQSCLTTSEAIGLLRTRQETAGLSDLYLLWLALNSGVKSGGSITLSWIATQAGNPSTLSPLVAILAEVQGVSPTLAKELGGLPISRVGSAADLPAVARAPEAHSPELSPTKLSAAMGQLAPEALASAEACPRRFALQWALGSSASFQMHHHHVLQYGNTRGRFARSGLDVDSANSAADALWAFLTPGERAVSVGKSRVVPASTRSADPLWTLTLGGSKDRIGPIDLAYNRARLGQRPAPSVVVPTGGGVLPAGIGKSEVCSACPVRPSCSVWTDPLEDSSD